MKIFVLIISIIFLNAAIIDDYHKRNYNKAEKELKKYFSNDVAKAYLAKIYFKEGKYRKAKRLWEELLKKNIPSNVKEEINSYLKFYKSKFKLNLKLDVGLLFDSNLNNAIFSVYNGNYNKVEDFAHIEEAELNGYFQKENISLNINANAQNRMYFSKRKYNKILTNLKAAIDYKIKDFVPFASIKYENLLNKNDVKKNDVYINVKTGIKRDINHFFVGGNYFYKYFYLERNVYKHNGINFFSGLRFNSLKVSLNAAVSRMLGDKKGVLYTTGVDFKWFFRKDFFINSSYSYDVAVFKNDLSHLHSLNSAITIQDSRHILYSFGLNEYYLAKKIYDLRKYEIYSKIIFKF